MDERSGVGRIELQELVEHHSAERTARERREWHQGIADVTDQGRSTADRFVDPAFERLDNFGGFRIRPQPACRHDRANPGDEFRGRRHRVAQVRQLEMGVCVDQTRQQRDRSEIAFGRRHRTESAARSRRCGRRRP